MIFKELLIRFVWFAIGYMFCALLCVGKGGDDK